MRLPMRFLAAARARAPWQLVLNWKGMKVVTTKREMCHLEAGSVSCAVVAAGVVMHRERPLKP